MNTQINLIVQIILMLLFAFNLKQSFSNRKQGKKQGANSDLMVVVQVIGLICALIAAVSDIYTLAS